MAFNAVPEREDFDGVIRFLRNGGLSDAAITEFFSSFEFLFGRFIFPLINALAFQVLYCDVDEKRPCYPVNILIAAELYAKMKNITDPEVCRLSRTDPTVKAALHLYDYYDGTHPITEETLERFRVRCENYYQITGIDLMRNNGLDMARKEADLIHTDQTKTRIDTGFVDSHIEKLTRLKLMYRCVARLMHALYRIDIKVSDQELDRDKNLKHYLDHDDWNRISYHDEETPYEEKLAQILKDAKYLLETFKEDPEASRLEDYYLLKLVFEQQVIEEEDGTLRLRKDKTEGLNSHNIVSPADPDAEYRKKADEEHEGYVGLSVDAGEGATAIRIYWDYASNTTADSIFLDEYLRSLPDKPLDDNPVTLVGDGLFSSLEAKELAKAKNVKIWTTDLSGKEPNKILNDFKYNSDMTKILACPNGQKMESCDYNEKNAEMRAHISKEKCEGCPFREQCVMKEQKKSNVIKISRSSVMRASNWSEQISSKDYKKWSRYRNGIECDFALLRTTYHIDEMPVRTFMSTRYWFNTVMSAINAKQVCKYYSELYHQEIRREKVLKDGTVL